MTLADPALSAAVVSGVVAGVAGFGAPLVIARLPEPEPTPSPPKATYRQLAAAPNLAAVMAAVSAVCGVLVGASVGWTTALAPLVLLCPVGVTLSYIDWRTKLLPRLIVLPVTAVVGAYLMVIFVLGDSDDLVARALICGVAYRSLFWVLWRISPKLMGFGDVRLALLLGFAVGGVGWGHVVLAYFFASLLGALLGRLLAKVFPVPPTATGRVTHPFGPFLMAGALLGVLLGGPFDASLVEYYLP